MKNYLNNAGAGIMSNETLNTIIDYLNLECSIGAYRSAQESEQLMNKFYERAARLINAENPNEIAFVDSASRAWNMALHGIKLNKGDRIITLSSEFGTNLVTLFDRAQRVGASVHVIQCDQTGDFSIAEFSEALEGGANIVAISHAAVHGSIVNPVVEIGKLAKRHNAIYLLDGCQAVGQLAIDVKAIQCDAYTATGRKWLRGPRGTGFLYVKSNSPIRTAQVDLASADLVFENDAIVKGVEIRKDARQFELWERSVAGMLGLSSAIEQYLKLNQEVVAIRIKKLAQGLRRTVNENKNLSLIGKVDSSSGVVGFYVKKPEMEESVRNMLEQKGLGFSTMGDWDCPLHFPKNGTKVIFRLSPHYYTSDSTVNIANEALAFV